MIIFFLINPPNSYYLHSICLQMYTNRQTTFFLACLKRDWPKTSLYLIREKISKAFLTIKKMF